MQVRVQHTMRTSANGKLTYFQYDSKIQTNLFIQLVRIEFMYTLSSIIFILKLHA